MAREPNPGHVGNFFNPFAGYSGTVMGNQNTPLYIPRCSTRPVVFASREY